MNCAAPPSSGSAGGDLISRFLNEPQPGPSWMGPPSQQHSRPTDGATAGSKGARSKKGHSKPGPQTEVSSSATAALSITSLAVERHASEASMDRSMRPVMTNQTSVQASKSSAKIILDDHQMGYLAVVPPDIEKDLMKYTVPARDGVIGPRPIKPSMLFDFDYRQKISNLLPHESHKEISAHLHIAWKSIGQDIHQLYKDLAKRVEQKLKALNGETEGVRAVQKRKAGGGGGGAARRTSREPPPNSGLRRCNCSPDCPKYKIISGSDLEKRWLAKFSRGERQKTVVLESFEGSSDVGVVDPSPAAAATPQSASGPRLFGAPRAPVVTPTPQRGGGGGGGGGPASDALSDPFPPQQPEISPDGFAQLPQHLLQPSAASPGLHPDLLSTGDAASAGLRPEGSSSSSTTPLDIAQAAATAANLVQESQYLQGDPNVYYSMPQYVFNPMQPTFPPFVDPTNLQQMDQFQGSYICPDGTIVNAQGEPIAMTLPLSQFANLAGPSVEAGNVVVDEAVANAESSAVNQYDDTAVMDAAPTTGDDDDDDDMAGGEASALRAMATDAVVEGEEAQMGLIDGGHVAEIQIGIDPDEIPSDVVSPSRAAVVEGSEADAGLFLGAVGRNVENAAASAAPSGSASPESPIVRAECDQPAGRDDDDDEGEPETTFTWHQVQAAEGREVPAQDIGWTWKRNVPTASSTSLLSDRKDEKEKSFALQANLNGVETESKEFKELKMTDGDDNRIPPPLDPRQTLYLEVEKKAETKSDGGGEREGDWEDEEREEEAEDREKGEEEKAEEGEVEEEREIESGEETNAEEEERVIEQENQVSAMECLPQVDVTVNVGIVDVGAHDIRDEDSRVAAIASASASTDLMDFLEHGRVVE